jgi:BMFP domain-containing protein YqiC
MKISTAAAIRAAVKAAIADPSTLTGWLPALCESIFAAAITQIRTDPDMLDPKQLEELAARLSRLLPPGLKGLRAELEDNFRAVLRANLDRLELVSRERFDTQAELLARTQAKLGSLEKRLKSLEKKLAGD